MAESKPSPRGVRVALVAQSEERRRYLHALLVEDGVEIVAEVGLLDCSGLDLRPESVDVLLIDLDDDAVALLDACLPALDDMDLPVFFNEDGPGPQTDPERQRVFGRRLARKLAEMAPERPIPAESSAAPEAEPRPEATTASGASEASVAATSSQPQTPQSEPPAQPQPEPRTADEDLTEVFLADGGRILDNLRTMAERLTDADEDPRARAEELRQELRALEGSARRAGITPIGDLSQALESLLGAMADDAAPFDGSLGDELSLAVERLNSMFELARQGRAIPEEGELIAHLALVDERTKAAAQRPAEGVGAQPEPEAETPQVPQSVGAFADEAPRAAGHPGGLRRVWVLGASIGGPQAIKRFLTALPADLPAAFVLAQHVGDGFADLLTEQLDRATAVRVQPAREGDTLDPGHVLVVPTSFDLRFDDDRRATLQPLADGFRPYTPSIDTVLSEVAARFGSEAGAIVFSGMGDDGLEGCRALHEAGGLIWAQDAESCVVSAMPDLVRDAGLVEFSDSPEGLAARLLEHVQWDAAADPDCDPAWDAGAKTTG